MADPGATRCRTIAEAPVTGTAHRIWNATKAGKRVDYLSVKCGERHSLVGGAAAYTPDAARRSISTSSRPALSDYKT